MTPTHSGHSALRPRRVVIYARISDDREGRRYGVDRQVKDCRELAEDNGDEVVAVFIDDDRSAYTGKKRVEYLKMLAYLRAGHAEGVLALAPTRLYRRLDDGLEFFKLINDLSLRVETVKAGRFKLNTADGRRDALRAAIDAQHESELIGERVRDAKADNVARGEYRGGPRPYGWESDGVTGRTLLCLTPGCSSGRGFDVDRQCRGCGADAVNKPESELWHIERGVNGIVAGESLRSLVRATNAAGSLAPERRYRNPDGTKGDPVAGEWDEGSFRRMIQRPRNAGLLEVSGEIIGRAKWPPAVPEDKWRAAVAILANPARRTSFSNSRVWLLSGLALCHCGSVVKCSTAGAGGTRKKTVGDPDADPAAVKRRKHVAAYRCRATGGHVTRRAEKLDAYIEALALDRLSRSDADTMFLPPVTHQDDDAELATQANALRAKLQEIAEDFGHDRIGRAQMLEMTDITRTRIAQVEAKMAARAAESVLASIPLGTMEIVEAWKSYDLDKKRSIIASIMEITLKPARPGRPKLQPDDPGAEYGDPTIGIRWKRAGGESE